MLKSNLIKKNSDSRLYHIPVPIIGLTGGIATGKSSVAELFRRDGYCVIDADKLVKDIYQTSEALEFVNMNFPQAIQNNIINFKMLRELVFLDKENQEKIELFIYQRLPNAFLSAYKAFNKPEVIIYDVPLLFEKGLNKMIDQSICVYAPLVIQIARLMKRDLIKEELANTIIAKQMSIEDKKIKSDWVIDNSDSLVQLECNYRKILAEIMN